MWEGDAAVPGKEEERPLQELSVGHPATWLFGHSREEGCASRRPSTTGSPLCSQMCLGAADIKWGGALSV